MNLRSVFLCLLERNPLTLWCNVNFEHLVFAITNIKANKIASKLTLHHMGNKQFYQLTYRDSSDILQ